MVKRDALLVHIHLTPCINADNTFNFDPGIPSPAQVEYTDTLANSAEPRQDAANVASDWNQDLPVVMLQVCCCYLKAPPVNEDAHLARHTPFNNILLHPHTCCTSCTALSTALHYWPVSTWQLSCFDQRPVQRSRWRRRRRCYTFICYTLNTSQLVLWSLFLQGIEFGCRPV